MLVLTAVCVCGSVISELVRTRTYEKSSQKIGMVLYDLYAPQVILPIWDFLTTATPGTGMS